jgi:hypothetical protein
MVFTFYVLSFDGFYCDVLACNFIVAFEHVSVLARADFSLEHVIVNHFGHFEMSLFKKYKRKDS